MKILLLRPNSAIINIPAPLGLLYLAKYLRINGYPDVTVVDARLGRLGDAEIGRIVREIRPDIVGRGFLSFEADAVRTLTAHIRIEHPATVIVAGGPHPSTDPMEALISDPSLDIAVDGEGEIPLLSLVQTIERGGSLKGIRGVSFRDKGAIVTNAGYDTVADIDTLGGPDWEKIDPSAYRKVRRFSDSIYADANIARITTTRGCPFRCIFCHSIFGNTVRYRSISGIVEEVAWLVSHHGVREIEFFDDMFNLDLQRAKELLTRLVPFRLYLSFPNGLRADRADDEFLDLLKEAGAYRVGFGIESGSRRIQKIIHKNLDLDKARDTIERAASRRFLLGGLFMLGLPSETYSEAMETVAFARESKLTIASFNLLKPFPGTEAARYLKDDDIRVFKSYNRFEVNISAMSDTELQDACRIAYRNFYFKPRRLSDIVLRAPRNMSTINAIFGVLWTSFAKGRQ